MIIKHNLASMGAFYQSKIISARNAKTTEHLASGYRINRAADDAAGLSISQKMRAQIRGLAQANNNIQDGISFVKIGEGGMQEVHDIVQRIRELSVKAANDTNTQNDRAAIQSEIDALLEEMNGIAYRTSFNEHYMLCGGAPGTGSGSGGSTGSVIDAAVSDVLSKRATYGGSLSDSMSSAIYNPDGTIVFCGSTASSDQDLDGSGSAAGTQSGWITKVGTDGEVLWTTTVGGGRKGFNSITATADGGYLTAGGDQGRPLLTKIDADGNIVWTYEFQGSGTDTHVNNAFLMQDGSGHVLLSIQTFDYNGIKDGNGNILLGGNSSSDDKDLTDKNKGGQDVWFLKLDGQTGENVHASGGGTGGLVSSGKNSSAFVQVGPDSGNHLQINYADMRTSAVFLRNAILNVMSQSGAEKVMTLCNRAIDYVSRQRSLYGSYQNALEHLYAANAITGENVTMSESMLADADIADEVTALSCNRIVEQANWAVMAQANMANQLVLKLLS